MSKESLKNEFDRSILSKEVKEKGADLIDQYISKDIWNDEDLLHNIPIIKYIMSGVKIYKSVKEKFFCKKIIMFLTVLDDIPIEEREKYINELEDNIIDNQKTSEYVLMMIERQNSIEKSRFVGLVYKKYIKKEITLTEMSRMMDVLDRINVYDLKNIDSFLRNTKAGEMNESGEIGISNGLLRIKVGAYISASKILRYEITSFGVKFFDTIGSLR